MTDELEKKVRQSVSLIQKAVGDKVVEVAYSGGKDSDVILELTKMAGVKYRAIYKNTTIDPVGTVKHCKEKGCEIVRPKNGITFFKLVEQNGFPCRHRRFCCSHLKEYKILDMVIIGVRKSESRKRAEQFIALGKLLQLRDYWVKKSKFKDAIGVFTWGDVVISTNKCDINDCALTFPTQEMADKFITYFRDLIIKAYPLV